MNRRLVVALGVLVVLPAAGRADLHSFPSDDSTVVGSVGFIGSVSIGYFWSVARGDKVVETFADPLIAVDRAIFDFGVPSNGLRSTPVDWDVRINSTLVGAFSVPVGSTGPMHLDLSFAPIANVGGQYTVAFLVTNEVPNGQGAHTLAYADPWPHTVELLSEGAVVPVPGAALLGIIGLSAAGWQLRRKTA